MNYYLIAGLIYTFLLGAYTINEQGKKGMFFYIILALTIRDFVPAALFFMAGMALK